MTDVARMSEATCGMTVVRKKPGYRLAHPGYDCGDGLLNNRDG